MAFPVFSAAADDKVKLRRGMRLAVRNIMFVNIPMMLGFAVVAEPVVLVLFGEQWLPVVPIFQVLCLGSLFWPLHVINLNVLVAQGHSNLYFRLEIINKVLGCSFLLVGVVFWSNWYCLESSCVLFFCFCYQRLLHSASPKLWVHCTSTRFYTDLIRFTNYGRDNNLHRQRNTFVSHTKIYYIINYWVFYFPIFKLCFSTCGT